MNTTDNKQSVIDSAFILAQEKYNESIRQAAIDRARRIDEALARGEAPPDTPHPDPAANAAIALTASPGLTAKRAV